MADGSNIHISTDYMALDAVNNPHKEVLVAEFERRKRMRAFTLPTDALEVTLMLRQVGQPICLFGEDKPERRERLREALSQLDADSAHAILHKEEPRVTRKKLDDETWYHEGPNALREARVAIASFSLPRTKTRLLAAQETALNPMNLNQLAQETQKIARNVQVYGSQIGDVRPVCCATFNPDSTLIATAGWSGLCSVWRVPDCTKVRDLRAHNGPASCVTFTPEVPRSKAEIMMASCAHDGSVALWDGVGSDPMAQLDGHTLRVSRVAFHPSGRFLATVCHDSSWRLFDIDQNEEVLFQEGHTKGVYDIDFQKDGALAATGGMDGYGRIWDLRTGRCIMFLEGHSKDVLSVAFAPNSYELASGSADNTIKMWDIRQRRCTYTIPAHNSLVSKVKFQPGDGHFLISSSYDKTVKLWSWPTWTPLGILTAHENKVMCCDISPDSKYLLSCGFDRTFKLWAQI